jgi:hypothetical protein
VLLRWNKDRAIIAEVEGGANAGKEKTQRKDAVQPAVASAETQRELVDKSVMLRVE